MRRWPTFRFRQEIRFSWHTMLTASPSWTVMSRFFRAGPFPIPLPGPPPESHQSEDVVAMTAVEEPGKEALAAPLVILDARATKP